MPRGKKNAHRWETRGKGPGDQSATGKGPVRFLKTRDGGMEFRGDLGISVEGKEPSQTPKLNAQLGREVPSS